MAEGLKERIKSNDIIALILLIPIIPGLWVSVGCDLIKLPGEIIGATIAGWTLILQYYFRKARDKKTANT